ncbi:MAG: Ig-like domain-containing protein [Lachnospiraceae bacterium]|nr:Ig-like domain-containing protein [Lachnospiraceae bacterium]
MRYDSGAGVMKSLIPLPPSAVTQYPTPASNGEIPYTGNPIELAVAGTATGGTMVYSVSDNSTTAPTEWSETIPTGTDVGTYYVWYKVKGDGSHNDTEPARFAVRIVADKTELNDAITEAETFYDSIKDDPAYEEIAAALKNAIDLAEAVAADPAATAEEVASAKEAVAAAKATAEKAKKEADKAAADKVAADAAAAKINALPASDKVAATDKAAIEAARKAYDALTADQKKLIDAATLKKLTDAETALAAALKPAEAALQEAKKESEDAMNMQAKLTQKGKTIQIKWTATKAADGYDVYVQYRGKNKKYGKPAMTITDSNKTKVAITKIGGKKINFAKSIKVKVLPFKIVDGKKVVLAKNNKNCLYGNKNKKATNAKSLKLKKSKVTLKKGKTSKIKATIKLVDKKKKLSNTKASPKLRYTSSDTSVATVTKKGKIKAVGKGTCTIYVSTLNGITKKVAVTVK